MMHQPVAVVYPPPPLLYEEEFSELGEVRFTPPDAYNIHRGRESKPGISVWLLLQAVLFVVYFTLGMLLGWLL